MNTDETQMGKESAPIFLRRICENLCSSMAKVCGEETR